MTTNLKPPAPLRSNLRSEWLLDPRIAFLNHGSFGAAPRCVLEEQTRWRMRIEAEPVEIIGRQRDELQATAKRAIGGWLGMGEDDFGLVTNATEGINAVLRSLSFGPEDELLTTSHVYHAVRQAMKYVASRGGAGYREVDVPLPVKSAEDIARLVLSGLSPRTRLLVLDHVTSPTALIFPVNEIVAGCAQRGVDVLIDGAHAPGMLPLDVPSIGAAYYTGNLHKWAAAPKGTGFLWVRPDKQAPIHPLIVSHFYGEGFAKEFGWQGTRDLAAWLTVPRGLQFMSELGWERAREHNHAMAAWVQAMLCDKWKVEPISPLDGQLLGSMATVRLPGKLAALSEAQGQVLQRKLYDRYQVEAPIMIWGGTSFVRPCCQVYNTPDEYHRLGNAILELKRE